MSKKNVGFIIASTAFWCNVSCIFLTCLFVLIKLTGLFNYSWWFAFSPLLILLAITVVTFIVFAVVSLNMSIFEKKNETDADQASISSSSSAS